MVLGPVTNVYLKNLSPLTEYTVAVFAMYDSGQSEALSGGFTTSKYPLLKNTGASLFCVKAASLYLVVGVDACKYFPQKSQCPLVFITMNTDNTKPHLLTAPLI